MQNLGQKYFRESFYETNIYIFEVFLRFSHFMPKITEENSTQISKIFQNHFQWGSNEIQIIIP